MVERVNRREFFRKAAFALGDLGVLSVIFSTVDIRLLKPNQLDDLEKRGKDLELELNFTSGLPGEPTTEELSVNLEKLKQTRGGLTQVRNEFQQIKWELRRDQIVLGVGMVMTIPASIELGRELWRSLSPNNDS